MSNDDKKRYQCCGGPYDREFLWLSTRESLFLTVRFADGRYFSGRYEADAKNQYVEWITAK